MQDPEDLYVRQNIIGQYSATLVLMLLLPPEAHLLPLKPAADRPRRAQARAPSARSTRRPSPVFFSFAELSR